MARSSSQQSIISETIWSDWFGCGGQISNINLILIILKDLIKGITEEVEYHKKEVQILRVEKEQLENVLAVKAQEVRKNLQEEATRVEVDLKKNLSNQRTENQKLQSLIGILK